MQHEIVINSIEELPLVAQKIYEHIENNNYNIVEFYGAMGAGKTTLINALCRCMGVIDRVTSPTFAIVNEYKTEADRVCYHFDFYRINKLEEVLDMGYEEYFYSGNLSLIEWPEIIEELLPRGDSRIKTLKLSIEVADNGSRKFIF